MHFATLNTVISADGLPHELEILAHQPDRPGVPLCNLLFPFATDIINEVVQKTPHDARYYRCEYDRDYLVHTYSPWNTSLEPYVA